MDLSNRAKAYLSTLERVAAPSEESVLAALAARGCPAFPAWLELQRQFGGYVEPAGPGDSKTFGIFHPAGKWIQGVEAYEHRGEWSIQCADADPAYDFWMAANGEVANLGSGGPYASFAICIERKGVLHEAVGRGWKKLREQPWSEERAAEYAKFVVPAASDEHATTYLTDAECLVVMDGRAVECFAKPA